MSKHIKTPKPRQKAKTDENQHFKPEDIGSDYEYISYIGAGSYGCVCKAKQKKTGKIVAIKKFSYVFQNDMNIRRLLRELRILRTLKNHPKIVKLIDIIPPNNLTNFQNLYIVLEFMDTDLSRLINSNQFLSQLHVQYILYQILLATKCLHSAKIFHRDLKPQNILVNENCVVKICDFGLSRGAPVGSKTSESRKLTKHVVTRWYRAPEVIFLTSEYTSKIDIWSIGCIFAELIGMLKGNFSAAKQRSPLFPGITCYPLSPGNAADRSENSMYLDQISIILHMIGTPSKIELGDFEKCAAKDYVSALPYWPGVDFRKKYPAATDLALDLLKKMLRFSPSQRPTVDEALSHPYLKKVREIEQEIEYPAVQFEFEKLNMRKHGRGILIREIMNHSKSIKLKLAADFTKLQLDEKKKEAKSPSQNCSKSDSKSDSKNDLKNDLKNDTKGKKSEKSVKSEKSEKSSNNDSIEIEKNEKIDKREYRKRTSLSKQEIK